MNARDRQLQTLRFAPGQRIKNADGDEVELRGAGRNGGGEPMARDLELPLVWTGHTPPTPVPTPSPAGDEGRPVGDGFTFAVFALGLIVWAVAGYLVVRIAL